jgi:hypothetical protein
MSAADLEHAERVLREAGLDPVADPPDTIACRCPVDPTDDPIWRPLTVNVNGRVTIECKAGEHGAAEVLAAVPALGRLEDDRKAAKARDELTALLKLDRAGCRIVGARVVGQGSEASADLYVVDSAGQRSEITFRSRRDVANAQRLNVEMSCFDVVAGLKAADAIQANVLLGRIATHETTATEDDVAADWGIAFLREADTLDVDLTDQTERWAAFSRLTSMNPWADVHHGGTLAGASLVLRHTSGVRWVRTSWFYGHVRSREAGALGATEVIGRMARVGWTRRNGSGRVKATHPTDPSRTPIFHRFYLVPAGWEETR